MTYTDISAAVSTDMSNQVSEYSVSSRVTDAGDTGEFENSFDDFNKYLGYYKAIPELRAVIDCIATWTVGKGFNADPTTTLVLDLVKGFGKDTFNTIMESMIRTMYINGDSFAEIIRDNEGNLINLKPLDPSSIVVISERGVIKRYEQRSKIEGKAVKKFKPTEIFHLARNRVADEVHGVSLIEALENIILMRNEAMNDYKIVMHRYVKPQRIWHLDTDNTTKIAGFKTLIDDANDDVENIIVPKGSVEHELVSVPQSATLSPFTWIRELNNYFFQAARVPQIIVGNSQEFTEASAKIAYLAFQQTIEEEQLFLEEQCGLQLGITISFEFPARLENDLLSDNEKDANQEIGFQPNETIAGRGQ